MCGSSQVYRHALSVVGVSFGVECDFVVAKCCEDAAPDVDVNVVVRISGNAVPLCHAVAAR